MKPTRNYILLFAVLVFSWGCDKDFVEINTNPYAITDIDPALLFAGAQRTHLGNWEGEHTIVQHFVNPYNEGATLGFNFNARVDLMNIPKWDQTYTGPIRNLTQALTLLGEDAERVNLRSMIRIWKGQAFMALVDTYGHVPYFDAGMAVSDKVFFPKYDNDAAIYDDIYSEIKSAVAALNPSADYVSADLFYGKNAQPSTKTETAADQVAKWKKLGNSLLLRLGMRYSKVNPTKAQTIVGEAVAGGVMTSNADNAYVKYDGALYVHAQNNGLRNFSRFYYAAEPFVDQLKSTNDPRAKFILANFENPNAVDSDPDPDTELANQFGAPIGVLSTTILQGAPHRGARGGGLDYSQMNIWIIASPAAPDFWVTYAQTSLLLAEAAQRGWTAGSAQTYYEDAIRADMQVYSLYPGTTPITENEINDYLAESGVAFDAAKALELINTQYWVVNLRNGTEAFANFRRSNYPTLTANPVKHGSAPELEGKFARRMGYPEREASTNTANWQAAATAIGGDNLTSRVFWDTP